MIIGICGKIGSGKDTIADYLASKYEFKKVVVSDIIRKEMEKKNLKINRESMQNFSKEMKEKYGNGIWARKTLEYIKEHKIKNVVISGVRDKKELEEFRKDPSFVLIFVWAPQKLRFQRLIKRGSYKDPKTLEEAIEQEKREEKLFDLYNNCKEYADYLIANDSTIENLHQTVDILLKEFQ